MVTPQEILPEKTLFDVLRDVWRSKYYMLFLGVLSILMALAFLSFAKDFYRAEIVLFRWNGKYPKKRQWAVDNISIGHNWIFWVDADEVVTPELAQEIREIFTQDPKQAGFFVKGQYILNDIPLKHGLMNNSHES